MNGTEHFNDIYLDLSIRKSVDGKTDENGNYYFEVEASNENIDLQDQIVLQQALIESRDEFLRGGVISYDHLHKTRDAAGNPVSDPSMVIGEPVDVKFDTETCSTIVKGKLYNTNEKARELINMLKAGSTRVRASVGGIFPKVIKDAKTGVEKITHVLWNDLALTVSPVNNTVGSAVFAKSLTAQQFVQSLPIEVKKSLYAGYGTDSSTFTGGRTLIAEDTSTKTINNTDENSGLTPTEQQAVKDLCILLSKGEIVGEDNSIDYLVINGIKEEKARRIVREIKNIGGRYMVKKSFTSSLNGLFKSLTGNTADDGEEVKKNNTENDNDDDISLNDDDDINEIEAESDDAADDGKDDKKKDEGDDDEMVDGTEVLKSLDSELKDLRKSVQSLQGQYTDLGGALEIIGKMIHQVGGQEVPPSSVINKSLAPNGGKAQVAQSGRPSMKDFYQVQDVLAKCVKDGVIDIRKSSMISSDVQRCMKTGEPMNQEYFEFLQRELKGVN